MVKQPHRSHLVGTSCACGDVTAITGHHFRRPSMGRCPGDRAPRGRVKHTKGQQRNEVEGGYLGGVVHVHENPGAAY